MTLQTILLLLAQGLGAFIGSCMVVGFGLYLATKRTK